MSMSGAVRGNNGDDEGPKKKPDNEQPKLPASSALVPNPKQAKHWAKKWRTEIASSSSSVLSTLVAVGQGLTQGSISGHLELIIGGSILWTRSRPACKRTHSSVPFYELFRLYTDCFSATSFSTSRTASNILTRLKASKAFGEVSKNQLRSQSETLDGPGNPQAYHSSTQSYFEIRLSISWGNVFMSRIFCLSRQHKNMTFITLSSMLTQLLIFQINVGAIAPAGSVTFVRTISFSIYQKAKYKYSDAIGQATGSDEPLVVVNRPGSVPTLQTVACFAAAGATAGGIITAVACTH